MGLLAVLASLPAEAQQTLPGQRGIPTVACGPGNATAACRELRRALPGQASPSLVGPRPLAPAAPALATPRPDFDDIRGRRLIPPSILALLNDRRIDPPLRAYLLGIAGKPTGEWTMQDLQMVTAVVPALTVMNIATARLSEFYEFLNLDPASLFEPQLGAGWQNAVTEFDPRNRFRRGRCTTLSRESRTDPSSVLVEDLLTCQDQR